MPSIQQVERGDVRPGSYKVSGDGSVGKSKMGIFA